MAIMKIEHVGIVVRDMETSITFYKEVLGMALLDQLSINDNKVKLAFLGYENQPDVVIELIEGKPGNFESEGRVNHLALSVDNIAAEIDRLKALNIRFTSETINTLPNDAKYIFFEGPDQELIELFQAAK